MAPRIGYGWLIQPTVKRPKHSCFPPGPRNGSAIRGRPDVIIIADEMDIEGSLWRCDCGQHWEGRAPLNAWWPITERQADRMQKRAPR